MMPKEDKQKPTQPPTGLPAAPDPQSKPDPNVPPDPNAPPDPAKRVHHEKRDPAKDPSKKEGA